ncbi:uncharacterized protein EKO05_0008484 [Ascochyta rabiei]|uniref:uncharacterized protein n=1 Tax=Didymella rabiei TaxID=5454 RepID=UPI0021FF4CDA|nr:uncharacterized protein EKO05_0008484 [Ascochyta rabiei]UPX18178.1 hypothetical protein EKO05_0008484 [Ascochyta rabiei]
MAIKGNSFGGLSTELEYMILAFLPCCELRTARLVNKKWAVEAASLLFDTVRISLSDTENRKVNALIDGPLGGFLSSVRDLCISDSPRFHSREGVRTSLLRLLGALPRDTLTTFRCLIPLDQHTIGILLRTQSRLNHLDVPVDMNEQNGLPGPNFVRANLLCLRRLVITVTGGVGTTYQGYSAWFSYFSLLEELCIQGGSYEVDYFEGWTPPRSNALLKLRYLLLNDMFLADSVSDLSEQIHLPSLQNLAIRRCKGTAALLESFTAEFPKLEDNALEVFEQTNAQDLQDHEAASRLLQVLNRLQVVILTNETYLDDSLLDLTALCEVGRTIRAVHISTSLGTRYYNADELKQLSATCPNIEFLCIGLVNLWKDINDTEILDDFELFPPSGGSPTRVELRKSLEILAGLSKLRTLSIANHPLVTSTMAECRYRHQRLADSIISFLAELGSPIELIIFNPAYKDNLPDYLLPDSSGHRWPFYSYQRGTISFATAVPRPVGMVVAVPIKREEIGLIEPLYNYFDQAKLDLLWDGARNHVYGAHRGRYRHTKKYQSTLREQQGMGES